MRQLASVLAVIFSLGAWAGCDDRPFVTAVDLPLQVIGLAPSDSAVGVARDVQVVVMFNLEVVEGSLGAGSFYLESLADPGAPVRVEAERSYEAGKENSPPRAVLTPAALLDYSTQYRLTLSTEVKRKADPDQGLPEGRLLKAVQITFTTVDPPPLQLLATAPGAETEGVARDASLTLRFSEPVDCAALQAAVRVTENFDPHPHTVADPLLHTGTWSCVEPDSIEVIGCDGDLCSAVFTPDQAFAYSSRVHVEIDGGGRDDGAAESFRASEAGGQLAETVAYDFYVVDPPPLSLIASTPAVGAEQIGREASFEVRFSENLECDTVSADTVSATITLDPERGGGTSPVAGTVECSAGGDSLTFTPGAALDWSATVELKLSGGAFDSASYPSNAIESGRATSKDGQLPQDQTLSFRVVDPPILTVTSTTPAAGAEGVSLLSDIRVQFSEVVDCASIDSAVSGGTLMVGEVDDAGRPVAHTVVVTSCSADTVVLKPSPAFTYSGLVTLTLPDTIASARATSYAGRLEGGYTLVFRAEDPPALRVASSTPASGAEGVALNASITLGFSESLDCATVSAALSGGNLTVTEVTDAGATVNHGVGVNCMGASLVLTTDADFSHSGLVTLLLPDSVASARATSRGGQLEGGYTLTFRAMDPPALTVTATSPAAGGEGAPLNSAVAIVFSELLDCGTVAEAATAPTITVTEVALDGGNTEHTFSYSCSGASLTLDPDADFDYSGMITVTLPDTIASARATSRGGQLSGGFVFSFRAQDPPVLTVTSTLPAAGTTGVPLDSSVVIHFSTALDCATVVEADTAGLVALTEVDHQGGSIEHTATVTCSADAITIAPALTFGYSSQVTATLPDSIAAATANARGGYLAGGYVMSFATLDPPVLVVTATNPGGSSATSNLGIDLTITFSEPIDCSSVSPAAVQVIETLYSGTDVAHGVSVKSCGGSTLVLDPAVDFQLSSLVRVLLPDTIVSLRATSQGGNLEGGYDWFFGIADPPDLLVLYTSPGDGNILVPADKQIVVRFSEPVQLASVGAHSMIVEDLTTATELSTACGTAADLHLPDSPCSYVPNGDHTSVTFTPPADYAYDHTIRFTLTTDIASAQSTTNGGQLGADLVYTFDVIPVPPIEVVSLTPPSGRANIPARPTITVVFNQDVLGSTLVVNDADPAKVTVWLNPGTLPDVTQRVALVCGGVASDTCTTTGTSFSFTPTEDLGASGHYTFVLRGDFDGVRGPAAGAIMVDDYYASYVVTSNTLIAYTDPVDEAVDVPVQAPVCVTFIENVLQATITTDTFAVYYVDPTGARIPVEPDLVGAAPDGFVYSGADPTTGLPPDPPDPLYQFNKVCFVPGPAIYGCRDYAELLPAEAEIAVELAEGIVLAGDDRNLTGGYSFGFHTAGLEQIVAMEHRNVLDGEGPLEDADDIPVNASFLLTFSAPVSAATVEAATTLVRLDTDAALPLGAVTMESQGLVAVIAPAAPMPYLDDLAAGLELRVAGGGAGVRTVDGGYLGDGRAARFHTSPKTTVVFTPPAADGTAELTVIPAIFSRPMYLPSVNSNNFYAFNDTTGVPFAATVATSADDLDSALLMPVPGFEGGTNVTITVTTGAMDYIGNPLPSDFTISYVNITSTSAVNSLTPPALAAGNVAPASGAVVTGDQVIVLTIPAAPKYRSRMLPHTFNDDTLVISEGGCAGARGVLGSENIYIPGGPALPDLVSFWADSLLIHGCTYTVTLVQTEFSNIYTNSNGDANVVLTYTAEQVAPTLQSRSPAVGAANVLASVDVVATFSEAMQEASFDPATTFTVSENSVNIPGVVIVEGAVATFVPETYLQGGLTYTVTLGGVKDLASNAFAGASWSFTVEATAPTVGIITMPDLTAVLIPFSEPVAPGSLTLKTSTGAGTVEVLDVAAGEAMYGCLELDDTGAVAVFSPRDGFVSGGDYQVTVTGGVGGVTDLGGTPLDAAGAQQTLTAP